MINFLALLALQAGVVQELPEQPGNPIPSSGGALIFKSAELADDIPHAIDAGWKGEKVCETLHDNEHMTAARCTFAPGIGHEKHYHPPHWGYIIAGGEMTITDAEGSQVRNTPTGASWWSDGVDWHEAVNTGDATTVYVIIEPKSARPPTAPDKKSAFNMRSCAVESPLDAYAGQWSVDWTYRTAPEVFEETAAMSVITRAFPGCELAEQFSGEKIDGPYFFEWTIALNGGAPAGGEWSDNAHDGGLSFQAIGATKKHPVQFLWKHENGRMQVRTRYSAVKKGRFTVERHLSGDAGKTWALTSRAHYQKDAP